jgi:DNA polymerase-3 subunit alpha
MDNVTKRLNPNAAAKGEGLGEVSFVLALADGSEVEVKLPGRYPISPQIAGAMKAVPGVIAVQEM